MSRLNMHRHVKFWSVYIMAAPAMKGLTYFKVGITGDVSKRICGVQTGCPLRISRVWAVTAGGNGHAQSVEAAMHAKLAAFHSHGEWFAMETDKLLHKRAMADVMAYGCALAGGPEAKWRQIEVPDLKKAVRELAGETAEIGRVSAKRQRQKALVQMVTQGRQVL